MTSGNTFCDAQVWGTQHQEAISLNVKKNTVMQELTLELLSN